MRFQDSLERNSMKEKYNYKNKDKEKERYAFHCGLLLDYSFYSGNYLHVKIFPLKEESNGLKETIFFTKIF